MPGAGALAIIRRNGWDYMPEVTRPGFNGPQWVGLTDAERVAKCHVYAREAAQLAQAAHAGSQERYRDLAAQWNTLAAEIEQAGQAPAP